MTVPDTTTTVNTFRDEGDAVATKGIAPLGRNVTAFHAGPGRADLSTLAPIEEAVIPHPVGLPAIAPRQELVQLGYNAKAYQRKDYWNEPTMTLWERSYLPEILRGLSITTGIFLRNMTRWITGRKGALTTYYPEEKRADYAPRNRGKHILTQRPDGSPQCIACNMCATVCPAKVIEIESVFDINDPAHPKSPIRFEIDYSRCVFCGMCIEACPEDAIRMVQDVPELPSTDRFNMWLTMEEMLTWNPQSDVAKPYPPKGGAPVARNSAQAALSEHVERAVFTGQGEPAGHAREDVSSTH